MDDYSATLLHQEMINKKPFLKKLYTDFYNQFKNSVNNHGEKTLVEIGSGGGFIKKIMPNVITSDVLDLPEIDLCFSAAELPFKDNSIDAIFMLNTFHHINNIEAFLKEVQRCLKAGGELIMIETANTFWSRFVYKNFSRELFDPSLGWSFDGTKPLFSSNMALAWIVFCRDRAKFEEKYPTLKIKYVKAHTPLLYILSGGFFTRWSVPGFTYAFFKGLEFILSPLNRYSGLFLTVKIQKKI